MSLPEKPLTRRELYLAKAAGQDVALPETDLTREEMYLREIANGGGGGDVTKEYVDNAISNAVADIDDDISALSDTVADKVDKVSGKSLSTNDYTDADKALVQDSPITVTATTSPISTANGKPRAITIYGKSEVVDGAITSAGEGWATVDLGTLDWGYNSTLASNPFFYASDINIKLATLQSINENLVCAAYNTYSFNTTLYDVNIDKAIGVNSVDNAYKLVVKNTDYTDAETFKAAMSGVLLCYQLADPTQGNCIAVKTDDGSGINGTMATFSTGTPLRGIPDSEVRDVMTWDGSSGEVTKNCGKVRLADLTWVYFPTQNRFYATLSNAQLPVDNAQIAHIFCAKYVTRTWDDFEEFVYDDFIAGVQTYVGIRDTDYNTVEGLVASLGDAELIYELATPTITPLTSIENDSIAGLRTFAPQTHAQNNAGATMTVEAYAGTANGQAVSELKQDVQSEISALKITQSATLTLTVAGWTNNAQTVTYEHDIGKRNSIDVEPTSIKAWTAAGILATTETANTITFECDTVPTSDLLFRVTSMEVR